MSESYEEFVREYRLNDRALSKMKDLIPEHMHDTLRLYFDHGVRPGHFIRAVLAGDLIEAVSRADEDNMRALPEYVRWLYNYLPGRPNGWGSYEAVDDWIRAKNST